MTPLEAQARQLHADGHQIQFEEQFLQEGGVWKKVGEKVWHYPRCGRCAEMRGEK
jgi:hypothetical protein